MDGLTSAGIPSHEVANRDKLFDPERRPANLVRLSEDTVLRIERLTGKWGSTKATTQIELVLKRGGVLGHVSASPSGCSYQVSGSNTVLRMRDAIYSLDASGKAAVLKGSAKLIVPGTNTTEEISASHKYTPNTGLVSQFTVHTMYNWHHDIWLPSDPAYIEWDPPPAPESVWPRLPRRQF
jgi:hypothetical protein